MSAANVHDKEMGWLSTFVQSLPFANAAMLLWGLAAGVPIMIHLLSRRKYRQTAWAAMEFLLAAVRKNARRIRIEQLILLLVRVAILVLLAAALADPVFSLFASLSAALGTSGRTHYLLVLDVSYSMDYRTGDKSRLDRAKELAAQVLRDSRQGDGFTLVLMADPPQVAISDPAFDPRDVADEIDSVRVRHVGANLPMTLAEIENVLQEVQRRHARLTAARVCFFTDLGRTTWEDAATPDCRSRIGRLGEQASLALFDVGQTDAANLAVTAFELRDGLVTAGREVTFEAEVQAFGTRERTGRRIVLLVDGRQVRAESAEVPSAGRATVSLTHTFDAPGEHQVEARLGDDALPIDNHRWLSVPVRGAVEVLCVEGREGAARHLAYALEPGRASTPRVRPLVRLENALLEQDLSRFDCVVLCNVGRFSREEAAALYAYVNSGGGVLVTLGDQVQPENYHEQLGGGASDRRVLPARLERFAPVGSYFFAPQDYRHPIVAAFAGHERSGLLTTPVWKYVQVRPYDPAAARVALAFDNGDPAIVEQRVGRGRAILLTTAVSPDCVDRTTDPPTPWTALTTWPSFPPLVQEMLAFAVRGRFDTRNVLVGEPLEGSLLGATPTAPLTVQTPSGETERVPLQHTGEISAWSFGGTTASGVYAVNFGPPLDEVQSFAVNVRTRESDLERFDPELLPGLDPEFHADSADGPLPSTKPAQYFRYFLGLVLVLLLTETALAWYFGNASA